jgi:methylthioribose-1-phosphate isomerase
MAVPDGTTIPIEQRPPEELLNFNGHPVAAAGAEAWNPSFDVTPAELVDALVTERRVVLKPNLTKMADMMDIANPGIPDADAGCGIG